MNPVRIIVDSTADVTPEVEQRVGVVPLTIHFGQEHFVDGVDIDHKVFYEKLASCEVLPTTSQATPFDFTQAYEKAIENGEDVVVITISSLLSGTYQSAVIAAEDFPGRVYVVDSKTVTIGSAILADYALQLKDRGLCAADIAEKLTLERENIHLIALLDTLEYLKRGGRISKTVAFAGGLLSIKPIICLDGGEVNLIGKARGSKQGGLQLDQEILNAGGVDFDRPARLGYTGLSDEGLQKYLQGSSLMGDKGLPISMVGGVVGTHAGPGAIAVAFFQPSK
jgi:DegV family protein with EDD domain